MTISEKSAYLKGLMDGMKLNTESDEGKMIAAMVELLGDVTKKLTDVEDTTIAISDELDQIEEDLDAIEDFILDDSFKFVKENDTCTVLSSKGKVFGVEAPNFVDLVVTDTEPGFAGNTATNTLKPATVETGAEVKVPLFINEGDKIQIDTRTGEYLSRSKV